MMVREIDSPMPMPCRFVVTKGRNSCAAISGGIPPPEFGNHVVRSGRGGDDELAAIGRLHGFEGVAQQVEQNLLNLYFVDQDQIDRRIELQLDPDRLFLGGDQRQRAGFLHHPVDAFDPLFRFPARDEVAQPLNDLPGPQRLLGGLVQRVLDHGGAPVGGIL